MLNFRHTKQTSKKVVDTTFNLANGQKSTMTLWFFILLKISTEAIKNTTHHLLRIRRLHYTAILHKF